MHKKLSLLIFVCILAFLTTTAFAQETIEVGKTVEGNKNQATWQLFLESGQYVQINLSSDKFDTILDLSNENGDLLMSNDDISFPDNTDSQIIFQVTETGNYILRVRSFGSDTPKDAYTLSVTEIKIAQELSQGNLAFDEPQTVSPNGAASIQFTFDAQEGEVVNISVVSQQKEDTNLSLYDPAGKLIASADDNRAGKDPYLLRFKLPQSGTYSLEIKGFNGQPLFSPIDVSLEKTQELVLNNSAQTISLGSSKAQDVLTLNTTANQSYTVIVSLSQVTDSTLFLDLQQEGEDFAGTRVSSSGVGTVSFSFVAKATGRARLYLSFFSFGDSDVQFTVQAQ